MVHTHWGLRFLGRDYTTTEDDSLQNPDRVTVSLNMTNGLHHEKFCRGEVAAHPDC